MNSSILEETLKDMYEELIYKNMDSHIEGISVSCENNDAPKTKEVIERWLLASIRK